MDKKRWLMAGMLLAPLAFIAAVCGDTTTRVENAGESQMTGVSVSGEGKVQGAPDLAIIQLGVTNLSPTVAEARDRAATSLEGIINSMKNAGVDEKDIQTSQLSISPEYNYDNGTQTLRGFRVTNTVTAKIRNIDNTGTIVDGAVGAGGDDTRIDNIYFTIDDPEDLREQAREAAVADARRRAETLARAGGVSLGNPKLISETSYSQPIPYAREGYAADSAAGAVPETPILPGELDVIVNVSVTFEIN